MYEEIHQILSLYKSIQLCIINEKGRILLNSVNCLNDIDFNMLKRRNSDNGVYFIPPAESDVLFLDDLTAPDTIPYQSIIVKTSPKKFQAHILTHNIMLPEQRTKFQRSLIRQFHADSGAASGMQPRRLPCFKNQKYKDLPIVKIVKNTILNSTVPVLDVKAIKINEPAFKKVYSYKSEKSRKNWNDFYNPDYSSADMRYACYLLRIGFTDEEIWGKLQTESPEISERKSGHLSDYLKRTTAKAHFFIS